MRKWRAAWQERLRILIGDAQNSCGAPNNAKEIVKEMRFGKTFKNIERDPDIKINLLCAGLNHEVREFLKDGNVPLDEDDDGTSGIETEQLELWPSPLRPLLLAISRSRVYVPSRGEHVELDPKKITRKETAEAGKYLIRLAGETRREGKFLLNLSKTASPDWM